MRQTAPPAQTKRIIYDIIGRPYIKNLFVCVLCVLCVWLH